MQISTAFMLFFSIFGLFSTCTTSFIAPLPVSYYLSPISPGFFISSLIALPRVFQGSLVRSLHLFLYRYLLPYTVFYLALLVSDFVIIVISMF